MTQLAKGWQNQAQLILHSPQSCCCHYYKGTDLPCRGASFTWDHLQWGGREAALYLPLEGLQELCEPSKQSPWHRHQHLFHSLVRKAKTGQASRCFIRGTSGHVRTIMKGELKRVSMGKAQSYSCLSPCRALEKEGRPQTGLDKDRNRRAEDSA